MKWRDGLIFLPSGRNGCICDKLERTGEGHDNCH